jgi:hypothetical protein
MKRGRRLDDGFVYWPPCPECGGHVGCYGRDPVNAVPADVYTLKCEVCGHPFLRSHEQIMAVQEQQKARIG